MKSKGRSIFIIVFLLIPLLHLLIFSYVPIIGNFVLSFTNWKGFGDIEFIGIRNYRKLFTNPEYIAMLKTAAGISLPLSLSLFLRSSWQLW